MGIIKYWLVNNYDLIYREYPKDAKFSGPGDFDYAIVDARVENFSLDIFNDLKLNSVLLIDPDQKVDRNFLYDQGGFDITAFENDQMYFTLENAFARHQFAKTFGNRGALTIEREIGQSVYVDNPLETIDAQHRMIVIYDKFVSKNSYQKSVLAYRQLTNLYPDDSIVLATDEISDEEALSNRLRLYLSQNQSYFSDYPDRISQYLEQENFDAAIYFAESESDFSKKIISRNKINMVNNQSVDLNYVFGFPSIYDGSARKNILIDISNFTVELIKSTISKLIDLMNQNHQIFIMLVIDNDRYPEVIEIIEPFIAMLDEPLVYDPDFINMDGSPKTNHEARVQRFSISTTVYFEPEPEIKLGPNEKPQDPTVNYKLMSIDYPNLVDLVQKTWIAIHDANYKWLLSGLIQREPVIAFDANQLLNDDVFHQFLEYFEMTGLTKRTNQKASMTQVRLEKDDQNLNAEERTIKDNWDRLINGN